MTIPSCLERLVIEVPHLVDPTFCTGMIAQAEALGFAPATITTEDGTSVVPDIRNNDRLILDDPELAGELWRLVAPSVAQPFKGQVAVGLNERLRVYRYGPGQQFDWHQDGEYRSGASVSRFTLMVYLNDDYEGGGTSFGDVFSPHVFQDFTVRPETGKALLFHHPLSHRGDPVLRGRKYVLRTDVMFEVGKV